MRVGVQSLSKIIFPSLRFAVHGYTPSIVLILLFGKFMAWPWRLYPQLFENMIS